MNRSFCLKSGLTLPYLLLACLYFLPVAVPYKGMFPLALLTVFAGCCSTRTMMGAMGFSALGDFMGICHNFWGQMGAFAVAHVAFIGYFLWDCRKERLCDGWKWKLAVVVLYGLVAGGLIVPHVQGVLQVGVMVYMLLILTMCGLAWTQQNRYYALGAWLFVISDTVLAWNKFVSPIEHVGYFIMVPYYLGQWVLFIQSVKKIDIK